MLFIDAQACTGCMRCELVCSYYHEGKYQPRQSRIRVIQFEEIGLGIPSTCADCVEMVCKDVCPSGAITLISGTVSVDEDRCIGCKQCVFVCPFGAAGFNEEKGTAMKCDLCGGEPKCVEDCAAKALKFIEIDQVVMKKKRHYYKDFLQGNMGG